MIIIKDDKLTHVESSTDILEHYGVKGMKKIDKEVHRYARGGTKILSKQLKKNEHRLFAPFDTEVYWNEYGTVVGTKYNPLLKRN